MSTSRSMPDTEAAKPAGAASRGAQPLRLALCNEVISAVEHGTPVAARQRDFERQCLLAARLGYQALEVAPFTLADNPLELNEAQLSSYRRIAGDTGMTLCGLHWLLVQPPGLSLVDADPVVRRRTASALRRLVRMAAALGADYLVHGSPKQRNPAEGVDPEQARDWAVEAFAEAADEACVCNVNYCLEPLAQQETSFVNTIAEAVGIVAMVGSPAFCTMIDCCAASLAETEPVPALLGQWLPSGLLRHVQLNDPNRKAPGQGSLDFAPIIQTLRALDYRGWLAVEPFIYEPDGSSCADAAARYLLPMIRAKQS